MQDSRQYIARAYLRVIFPATSVALFAIGAAAAELPVLLPEQTLMISPSVQIHTEAIDGNTIVLGAPMDASLGPETGALHVFERPPGGTWVQTAWLQSSDAERCQRFGEKVDIEGSTIVASRAIWARSCNLERRPGGVYAFERTGGAAWTQTLNREIDGGGKTSLSFDGTTLLHSRLRSPALALTRDPGASWAPQQQLMSVLDDPHYAGAPVSIHDGLAAIGGYHMPNPQTDSRTLPAAALWQREGAQWRRLPDVRVQATALRRGGYSVRPASVSVGPQGRLALDGFIFERGASGQYEETATLRPPCTREDVWVTVRFDEQSDLALVHTGPYEVPSPQANAGDLPPLAKMSKLHLYRRLGFGQWQPVAQLIASDHSPVGLSAIDSGVVVDGTRVWDSTAETTSYQFSNVDECLGHRGNWVERNPGRWAISNGAYSIITTDYTNQSGSRPGEYALISQQIRFRDFDLTMKARSEQATGDDYVVLFGYQDELNYHYVMFSRFTQNNELFKVVDGVRHGIALAPGGAFTDSNYHQVDISRRGSRIRIKFDGSEFLDVTDASFREGAIGIGSFNDAVSFDDIDVQEFTAAPPAIGALMVDASAAGANLWRVKADLQNGDQTYADRTYTFVSLPAELQGSDWIQPAADSKTFTDTTLARFVVGDDSDVYIALDTRVAQVPSWLGGWAAVGDTITVSYPPDPVHPLDYDLYRKHFAAGSTVTLGNNGSTVQPNYIPIVKPVP